MTLPIEITAFLSEVRATQNVARHTEMLAASLRELDFRADGNPEDARAFESILRVLRRYRTIGAKLSVVGWHLYRSKCVTRGDCL